jgi:cardiolipin synthase
VEHPLSNYWPHFTFSAVVYVAILVTVIPLVLLTKKEPTSAVAWCLAVLLMPLVGALLFWFFGYNRVHRQVRRKRAHLAQYRESHPPRRREADRETASDPAAPEIAQQALRAHAYPASAGNAVVLYHDTSDAYHALFDAVREAMHHVHLEFFSIHGDESGTRLLDLLAEKARAGVQVRLLLDAVGSLYLRRRAVRNLLEAGGKKAIFFPLNRLRSLVQVNMRNHRKIVVVDGRIGFTGGMNIGDSYLGKDPYFGYWRDTFLRIDGPAVAGLQRTFAEDWDFTTEEALTGAAYFPDLPPAGDAVVQVATGGPDQSVNCIREIYFMGMVSARQRLWIASPYFVPDQGLLDALRLACYRGADVRLLTIHRPDHYLAFYAGRYYFTELLEMGIRVYLYRKGMMHSKFMLVDGSWGLVGSANLDIRSLRLDFEAGVILHSAAQVSEMEAAFERDLADSELLDAKSFASRSMSIRLLENACRLLAPAL